MKLDIFIGKEPKNGVRFEIRSFVSFVNIFKHRQQVCCPQHINLWTKNLLSVFFSVTIKTEKMSTIPDSPSSAYSFDPLVEFQSFDYSPFSSFELNDKIKNEIIIMKGSRADKDFQKHLAVLAGIVSKEMKIIQLSLLKGNDIVDV